MTFRCKICEQLGQENLDFNLTSKSGRIDIHFDDNLVVLEGLASESIDLIYIDPPFNTKRKRTKIQLATTHCQEGQGDRVGFKGKTYQSVKIGTKTYRDQFSDYLGFLHPRLVQAHRLLAQSGSLFLHLDYREVHYIKVMLDEIFSRECFKNEIIWAYDYGGRSKSKWSAKHDNILWYVKNPDCYTFHFEEMERIPYMAPGLVGKEKAERGKCPTDCWWHTIVPTTGSEKTGYPTQKPLGIINRIVHVHSNPNDTLLDFFAGSGTLGVSAYHHNRNCILIDDNLEAVEIMARRLAAASPRFHNCPQHISNSRGDSSHFTSISPKNGL